MYSHCRIQNRSNHIIINRRILLTNTGLKLFQFQEDYTEAEKLRTYTVCITESVSEHLTGLIKVKWL
jgi:hypothetical protein